MPIRIALLAALLVAPGLGAQSLVANGSFDEDLSGWTTLATVGAFVEWTPDGRHGGGILMDGSAIATVGGGAAWTSECLQLGGGEHSLGGDVRLDGIAPFGFCALGYRRYMSTDCTGSHAARAEEALVNGSWQSLGFDFVVSDPEGDSFEVVLQTSILGGSGERRCVFDNIWLLGPTAPTLEIPTSSPVGLGILLLGLAIAGLRILRTPR